MRWKVNSLRFLYNINKVNHMMQNEKVIWFVGSSTQKKARPMFFSFFYLQQVVYVLKIDIKKNNNIHGFHIRPLIH